MGVSVRSRKVVVVGSGLAGTATAIRLLRGASAPVEVVLWERQPDFRTAGPAYHRAGNPWDHIFNIQAGRMSLFREDTLDFVRWANTDADRSDWPLPWKSFHFEEHTPAPRRIFHDYLEARLAEAGAEAAPGVRLTQADGEVVDLLPGDRTIRVVGTRRSAGRSEVDRAREAQAEIVDEADFVVLATGLELRRPAYAARVRHHPAYLREPYSRHGVATLREVDARARVCVVGSVLSAYDTVTLLLNQGHLGTIIIVSGSGTLLRAYPDAHTHDVIHLPPPTFAPDDFSSRTTFLEAVRREWRSACALARTIYPDLAEEIVPERVAKAWEPHTPAVIARLDDEDLRQLLDEFGTTIATLRVGAMAHVVHPVQEALASGDQVHRMVGVITDVDPAPAGHLEVSVRQAGSHLSRIDCDLLVDSFGREPNYRRVESTLWRSLANRGLVTPHRRTGRGLEVDDHGRPVRADGSAATRIALVGGLREGDEIVRHGRSGAFSLNLAAIKNHSLAVAMKVIEVLEFSEVGDDALIDRSWTALSADGDPRVRELVSRALHLEIQRLSEHRRTRRARLGDELSACLAALARETVATGGPSAAAVDVLRLAVRRQAVRAMGDVSVPPKALRRILDLEPGQPREGRPAGVPR